MAKSISKISFSATLLRPDLVATADPWTFLTLPPQASAKLPSRGMCSVAGTLNGHPFHATLEPDGQGSHWLKVDAKLRTAAGLEIGNSIQLVIAPVAEEPEPPVPQDLEAALAGAPAALDLWVGLTRIARRDWIQWLESAKQSATRLRRIQSTISMLLAGKRRVCCFDRSGIFSKGLSAPRAKSS